jgi:hypothetical protein
MKNAKEACDNGTHNNFTSLGCHKKIYKPLFYMVIKKIDIRCHTNVFFKKKVLSPSKCKCEWKKLYGE